jgi:hypothetical protein
MAAVAVAGATLDVTATTASASAPPTSDPEGSAPAVTLPPGTYEDGTFTAPDRSFTVRFASAPGQTLDDAAGTQSYVASVGEDTQSVLLFSPTALGATAASGIAERGELFIAASGRDVEMVANTPTNLGPYPASHFAARLTLVDERPAVVYGVVVDRGSDVL